MPIPTIGGGGDASSAAALSAEVDDFRTLSLPGVLAVLRQLEARTDEVRTRNRDLIRANARRSEELDLAREEQAAAEADRAEAERAAEGARRAGEALRAEADAAQAEDRAAKDALSGAKAELSGLRREVRAKMDELLTRAEREPAGGAALAGLGLSAGLDLARMALSGRHRTGGAPSAEDLGRAEVLRDLDQSLRDLRGRLAAAGEEERRAAAGPEAAARRAEAEAVEAEAAAIRRELAALRDRQKRHIIWTLQQQQQQRHQQLKVE